MFDEHLEVLLADTDWAKNIHYDLRYRVYCLERGYEDPQAHPDAREQDSYDDIAAHFLVRSIESREWLAGLRLVTVPFESLPMNKVCEVYRDRLPQFESNEIAEVSRLCAIPTKEKMDFADGTTTSWISMGLIRAARSYALEHGIRYFFFFISDSLARILKRVGIEFTPIGPVSEYRGKRRPYIHDVRFGYREMPLKAPDVHQMFCNRPGYGLASKSYRTLPKTTNNRRTVRQSPYGSLFVSRS